MAIFSANGIEFQSLAWLDHHPMVGSLIKTTDKEGNLISEKSNKSVVPLLDEEVTLNKEIVQFRKTDISIDEYIVSP